MSKKVKNHVHQIGEEQVVLNRLKDEMKAKLQAVDNDKEVARRISVMAPQFPTVNSLPGLLKAKSTNIASETPMLFN